MISYNTLVSPTSTIKLLFLWFVIGACIRKCFKSCRVTWGVVSCRSMLCLTVLDPARVIVMTLFVSLKFSCCWCWFLMREKQYSFAKKYYWGSAEEQGLCVCLSAPDVFDVIVWGRTAGAGVRTRHPSGRPGASHSEKKMDWAPQIVSSDDFLFSASSTGQLLHHFTTVESKCL